ncbi:Serine protease 27 [Chelonia mydas]|uniref:Serine protease 27 n=1 Tax=Chelonia mydas TaxID=8469 RepID=M7AZM9_CHEMY|nr:Serine protease 27 [Chelonia mydas]
MGCLLLLIVLMGAQHSEANGVCGKPQMNLNRIVKGKDTVEGEFPWQASIQWKGVHMCGASLINDEWVVTAAHCFYQVLNLTQYRVVLGANQLLNPGPNSCACPVRRIITHPSYAGQTTSGDIALVQLASRVNFTNYILPICLPDASVRFPPGKVCWVTGWGHMRSWVRRIITHPSYAGQTTSGDIALVQLASRVNFTNYILPICLPDASVRFPPGKVCWVTGWGHMRSWVDLPSPQTLQKVRVPIIDSETCRNLYLTDLQNTPPHRDIQADMICAGYAEGRKDACNGDSGGPMACIVGDVWVLAGVVSWGEGCAIKNRPGVYSRLTSYQSWIREYIPNLEFVKERKGRGSRAVADPKGQKHPYAGWPSQAASVVASTLLLLACLLYLI